MRWMNLSQIVISPVGLSITQVTVCLHGTGYCHACQCLEKCHGFTKMDAGEIGRIKKAVFDVGGASVQFTV